MTSWAVDLKDIGAIYPFQGAEVLMAIVGIAFWVLWHFVQMRQEAAEIDREEHADASGEKAKAAIDRY
jgi:hypothetical protein